MLISDDTNLNLFSSTINTYNESFLVPNIGVDYNVSDTLVLQPEDERVAVPINIFDDALPEQPEYFQLRIRRSSDFRLRQSQFVFLSITDNDRKTLCHVLNSM